MSSAFGNFRHNSHEISWEERIYGRTLSIKGLEDLFCRELEQATAFKELVSNWMKMATSFQCTADLIEALDEHIEEARIQQANLRSLFEKLDLKPSPGKPGSEFFSYKLERRIRRTREVIRDLLVISWLQKLEHQEIAYMGTLRSFSQTLGWKETSETLYQILNEDRLHNHRLSEISQSVTHPGSVIVEYT